MGQLLCVGRGQVREALRLPSVEGFVRSDRNKGAVVAQASKAIVAEAFEVRGLLEGLCARRAARHVRDGGSNDALRIAASEERRRSLDEESLALMQANERLHQLIVSVGSSATAERMLEQLQLPKVRTLFFRVMSPVIWRASRDDHLAILTAIIDGDEDRAEHAMRDHVRQTATLFAGLPESSFA